MSDDLFKSFDDVETQFEGSDPVMEEDLLKSRRKELLAGKAELTEEDFGVNTEAWEEYQAELQKLREFAGNDQAISKAVLQSLHKGKFRRFVPGGRASTPRTPKESAIPQLARFNELMRKGHEAFSEWLKTQTFEQELADYLNELGYEGDVVPYLTSYWHSANVAKKWIKQNFGRE